MKLLSPHRISLFVATIFAIILPLSDQFSIWLSLILIALVGIPHGAIDHMIHRIIETDSVKGKTSIHFYKTYLIRIVAFTFLWFVAPSATFFLFIIISAFHFGQTQYSTMELRSKNLLSLLWGLFLFTTLFSFHLPVLEELSQHFALASLVFRTDYQTIFFIASAFLFIFWSYLLLRQKDQLKVWYSDCAEIVVLILLFSQTNLLLGFSIYFAFSHSLKALGEEFLLLKGQKANYSIQKMIGDVAPYTLLAITGMVIGYIILTNLNLNVSLLLVLIVLISAISFPHIVLFDQLYKKE